MSETNGAKKDDAKFDGVLNELRNVLSGLGRTPPPPADRGPFDDVVAPEPAERLGTPVVEGASKPSEPLSTDADFWNGNVLGWPTNADADLPEAPVLADATTEPAPSENQFFRDDTAPAASPFESLDVDMPMPEPFMPEPVMPEELVLPKLAKPAPAPVEAAPVPPAPPVAVPVPPTPVVPEPAPVAPPAPAPVAFTPPIPAPIEKTPDAWPLINEDAEDLVPQPPPAPTREPAAPSKTVTPSANPWLHPDPGMEMEAPAEPAPVVKTAPVAKAAPAEPPASARAASLPPAALGGDLEFELPIPGTKETKDKPAAEQPALDLEGTEMKPEDLVHVACVYPEGQEKAGQTFVNKLREAAEKMRRPMNVQAVFVSSWTPDKVDPAAWAKSAALSGADSIFVLSFRASAGLFKNLAADTAGKGPKARLVLIEQTNFPTLYADVLVELRRAK